MLFQYEEAEKDEMHVILLGALFNAVRHPGTTVWTS